MYKIENRTSGYILTFAGVMNQPEMQIWYNESKAQLDLETQTSFGVIIDMRNLAPLSVESQNIMIAGQQLYKDKGMNRSAVLLADAIICLQFVKLAKKSGIYATERYIDVTKHRNPIDIAINWVKDALDPDL